MMSVETRPNHTETTPQTHDFLDYALRHGFGELHFKVDVKTGMKAMIAIHNTKLGPALGGCRFIEYPDTASAINDAMRLARGMSFKSAMANLPLGGGKAVIIKPSQPFDREAYMHCFGQFVEELNGRYVTALDSGSVLSDMAIIAQHTRHVASLESDDGDPSPSTARGVLRGIEAAVLFQTGRENLNGMHMAIQGLGHVGYLLAKDLHKRGVKLSIADINTASVERAVREFGARAVSVSDIHKVACDVFVPCALGAIINDITIDQFQTSIIAGAANNQLAHTYHGQRLTEKGILYAPDYVINAGGVIFAASKYLRRDEETVTKHIDDIATTLVGIFERSKREHRATSDVADAMAQEKLA